mmetsp:Transcript_19390/g.38019  ORF Transcript_19390/g.38019 Transcript_19390/m.38019 type:complete len:287 (-) Transcript_19390:107-967(-)
MDVPLLIAPQAREGVEEAAKSWLASNGVLPQGYVKYLGDAIVTAGSDDPEYKKRAEFVANERNGFRWLIDNVKPPVNINFERLSEAELNRSFDLVAVKKGKPPSIKIKRAPSVKINIKMPRAPPDHEDSIDPSPASKRARTEGTPSKGGSTEKRTKDSYESSRLAHVLQETLDRLLRIRFHKSPFKGSGYPFDNPFAVRLESSGNVVPKEYFEIIKEPMDLSKVKDKYKAGMYKTFSEFKRDISLIIQNSKKYHDKPKTAMSRLTQHFEKESKKLLDAAQNKLSRE